MRHGMVNRKLGRTSGHRLALFRNQLASLIEKERIVTTLPKAKELRPQIERLVTLGRNDSIHARRQAARIVADDTLVSKLFGTLGPRFANTPGGYTRIIKLGPRRGDSAEMAILEFVGYEPAKQEKVAPAPAAKTRGKKPAPAPATETEGEDVEEEKKPKKPAAKKAAPKKAAPKKAGAGGAKAKPPARKKKSDE
jgi:large subunit ribosomal protein L17